MLPPVLQCADRAADLLSDMIPGVATGPHISRLSLLIGEGTDLSWQALRISQISAKGFATPTLTEISTGGISEGVEKIGDGTTRFAIDGQTTDRCESSVCPPHGLSLSDWREWFNCPRQWGQSFSA